MISRFDEALDFFLRAEKEVVETPSTENEKTYGMAKYALFIIAKETKDALLYYANGGNDNGRTANEVLKPRPTKQCKTC